ncbi:hypothetical protein Bpfe_001427 [Biomphalaria pfeifferi]|uniref:Uncharacterized protein n=1 Tax=Biomphalaria pfeifferi TaxID=112525 RepID=A0AAD8FM06_BIOPF|nr:hypothetical protein Bpfe_001427 [Biomphalaria pfeifferi]
MNIWTALIMVGIKISQFNKISFFLDRNQNSNKNAENNILSTEHSSLSSIDGWVYPLDSNYQSERNSINSDQDYDISTNQASLDTNKAISDAYDYTVPDIEQRKIHCTFQCKDEYYTSNENNISIQQKRLMYEARIPETEQSNILSERLISISEYVNSITLQSKAMAEQINLMPEQDNVMPEQVSHVLVENSCPEVDHISSPNRPCLHPRKSISSEQVSSRRISRTSSLPTVLTPRPTSISMTPLGLSMFSHILSVAQQFLFYFLRGGLSSVMFISDLFINFIIFVLAGIMHIPGAATLGAFAKSVIFLTQMLLWLVVSAVELFFYTPTYLQLPYLLAIALVYYITPNVVKECINALVWAFFKFFSLVKKAFLASAID